MTDAKLDSTLKKTPGRNSLWTEWTILAIVCTLFVLIFGWIVESALLEVRPQAENSFYNLLVQGFRAGQLNIITPAPPGLTNAANPYDIASFGPYIVDVGDMSYYKGKLYLYWGVTPALVLFWPYVALTGHYLSDADAILFFSSLGFLIMAGLLNAVRRRYFPEAPVWLTIVSIVALALSLSLMEMLWQFSAVYHVALSCGFAFAMASLAGIWGALHQPKRQIAWLLLASLAYGLAIGSRPSLVFGAIILLTPVIQAWRGPTGPSSPRRAAWLLLAAATPVTLIVLGLMAYNQLRFDNPFEFGWHYQLNSDRVGPARQFSPSHLFFNIRFYFLEPVRWTRHFPFVQTIPDVVLPSGSSPVGKSYGGILFIIPLVWLALAVPLAGNERPTRAASSLRWFVTAAFLQFIVCAFTICLFAYSFTRYAIDFLPALLLLAFIGILNLEDAFRDPITRRKVRAGWCLLTAVSLALSIFVSVETFADANYTAAMALLRGGRASAAIEFFQKAAALDSGSGPFHYSLGNAYQAIGSPDQAVSEYRKALEMEPNFPDAASACYSLGNIFLRSGQMDDAMAQYRKALQIQPEFADAQNNLGLCLLQTGQAKDAIGYFEKALRIKPDLASAQYNLGRALFRTGHPDKAVIYLRKALEMEPGIAENNNVAENNNIAWSLATNADASKRDGELAVKLAEGACKRTQYGVTVMVGTLAAAYAEAGHFGEAIATAQKACALASKAGDEELLKNNQTLLALYLKHQPYHESQGNLR